MQMNQIIVPFDLDQDLLSRVKPSFGPLVQGCFHVCDLIMDGCKKSQRSGPNSGGMKAGLMMEIFVKE